MKENNDNKSSILIGIIMVQLIVLVGLAVIMHNTSVKKNNNNFEKYEESVEEDINKDLQEDVNSEEDISNVSDTENTTEDIVEDTGITNTADNNEDIKEDTEVEEQIDVSKLTYDDLTRLVNEGKIEYVKEYEIWLDSEYHHVSTNALYDNEGNFIATEDDVRNYVINEHNSDIKHLEFADWAKANNVENELTGETIYYLDLSDEDRDYIINEDIEESVRIYMGFSDDE